MALTEYVIMPGEDYQAVCDAIRAKTGKTEALKSGDLSAEVVQIEVDDGSKEQLKKLVDGTIESYVFPEDVTKIREGLFWNCQNLTLVEMHEGITEIGEGAFQNCTQLLFESLPQNLIRVNDGAFKQCSKVSLITLPENIEYIGSSVFLNTACIFSSLPLKLTEIKGQSFFGIQTTELILHSNIIKIEYNAFTNCQNLTTVTFLGTPNSISSSVFQGCSKLTTINVPWSESEVAGAPWGATNATINYNYVEPILWEVGFSCFGISENKIVKNGGYPNRITAHQAHGQFDFKVAGQSAYEDNHPITVPSNATTLSVSVPEEYVHGVIFWKCNGFEDTAIIKDYGWNGNQFVYDLANYPGTTHITINIKKPDNSNIDYTGDFSDFSVVFGTEEQGADT